MGESGGAGMSVPSVREKLTGVSAGRVKRCPKGLPFAGIICSGRSQKAVRVFVIGKQVYASSEGL